MRRRRPLAIATATLLIMSACGTEEAAPAPTNATAPTTVPAATTAPTSTVTATTLTPFQPGATIPADAVAVGVPVDEPANDDAATTVPTTEAPATTVPETSVPATSAPASDATANVEAGEPQPDEDCAAMTEAVGADGPMPVIQPRPESAESPFTQVAVRRLNCGGGWVNFANEMPNSKPLLIWFWAPH